MVDSQPKNATATSIDPESEVTLTGRVTEGSGDARHFISLSGYREQFREKLGYEPFAGTLNVELTGESVRHRTKVTASDGITIEGWEDGDQSYGPAYCYPTEIEAAGGRCSTVHIIEPVRTRHGEEVVELLAPVKLRDELPCGDGEYVSIHVPK
jgi:riboflavin kinase